MGRHVDANRCGVGGGASVLPMVRFCLDLPLCHSALVLLLLFAGQQRGAVGCTPFTTAGVDVHDIASIAGERLHNDARNNMSGHHATVHLVQRPPRSSSYVVFQILPADGAAAKVMELTWGETVREMAHVSTRHLDKRRARDGVDYSVNDAVAAVLHRSRIIVQSQVVGGDLCAEAHIESSTRSG